MNHITLINIMKTSDNGSLKINHSTSGGSCALKVGGRYKIAYLWKVSNKNNINNS